MVESQVGLMTMQTLPHLLNPTNPTIMVFMIWRVTFSNGVRIGMMKITIVTHLPTTHQGQRLALIECRAGAVGLTIAITCVWLTATTIPMIGTAPTGFDVCQDRSTGRAFFSNIRI